MRESCLNCVKKHLAQATILISEYEKSIDKKGNKVYPHHKWYALGHLAEAEDESIKVSLTLSDTIRKLRLKWEKGKYVSVEPIFNLVENLEE